MMIDPYNETWLDQLAHTSDETNMYLLIDGVFVPGLFRAREFQPDIALLFEALPACNDETRNVSPFLLPVKQLTRSLARQLERCSGWPMVSVIETTESLAELAARLAAWCMIEVDDQRFNFRFPDTRRLPTIFATLTARQRAELSGPASRWSYIGRDGNWAHLKVEGKASEVATRPVLENAQFGALVADSEPDEVLLQLAYRGYEPAGLPSVCFARACAALRIADEGKLAQHLRVDWCEFILKAENPPSATDAASRLTGWRIGRE